MLSHVDGIDSNSLLNTSVDDLCDSITDAFSIAPIRILDDQITVKQDDIQVDVSQDRRRYIRDTGKPFYVPGTKITFFVPFEGDAGLFRCRPSTLSSVLPEAVVSGHELVMSYERTDHDSDAVKSMFNSDLSNIRAHAGWIAKDINKFNSSLPVSVRGKIEQRRKKVLNDQGMVSSLGFPMRQREGVPRTYTSPDVKRKVHVHVPTKGTMPFKPEPTLGDDDYEHILQVISNMVAVMERSPKAFKGMGEEDLRQHFLVQLNGQYEGQATGETFNFEGKTDILIRAEGKNIFIGECKVWNGPKVLSQTIDQLLGYTCWRDTKTAILIFNRKKNFSDIIKDIPQVVKKHSNFKRELSYNSETGFRFKLHHRDDENRELVLTILAFEVPV